MRGRPGKHPGLLEDVLWLLEGGLSESEVMSRYGYTKRGSWLVALGRAGVPPLPHNQTRPIPSTRARILAMGDPRVGHYNRHRKGLNREGM